MQIKRPFKNEAEKIIFYLSIEKVLAEGSRRLSREDRGKNLDKKKAIFFSMADRGLIVFRKQDKILPPNYAYSISDSIVNSALLLGRYTKEELEYNVETGELIQIPSIEA